MPRLGEFHYQNFTNFLALELLSEIFSTTTQNDRKTLGIKMSGRTLIFLKDTTFEGVLEMFEICQIFGFFSEIFFKVEF